MSSFWILLMPIIGWRGNCERGYPLPNWPSCSGVYFEVSDLLDFARSSACDASSRLRCHFARTWRQNKTRDRAVQSPLSNIAVPRPVSRAIVISRRRCRSELLGPTGQPVIQADGITGSTGPEPLRCSWRSRRTSHEIRLPTRKRLPALRNRIEHCELRSR